jgi:peptidoglycan/xylan/chitin deacetylase (PgdA/CDA1 family)
VSVAPDRVASMSLDLDDLWTYLRTHGDATWTLRPSYLREFIPFALDELDRAGVKVTFFVVGADAAAPANRPLLRAIMDRGHELGNHSFEHEPFFHRFTRERVGTEVLRTHDAIADATGYAPKGFRGPGYSWSPDLLEVLAERGYLYDASTLPTYLGPLARAYYFGSAKLTPEQKADREQLFGTLADGLRPVMPYYWQLTGDQLLLEIPVTTLPVVKLPFHLTYLHYLSRLSGPLAMGYLHACLSVCRLAEINPSFILHPLDLFGGDRAANLTFFPGMDLPTERKLGLFHRVVAAYSRHFELVPMSVHATLLAAGRPLSVRRADHAAVREPLTEI